MCTLKQAHIHTTAALKYISEWLTVKLPANENQKQKKASKKRRNEHTTTTTTSSKKRREEIHFEWGETDSRIEPMRVCTLLLLLLAAVAAIWCSQQLQQRHTRFLIRTFAIFLRRIFPYLFADFLYFLLFLLSFRMSNAFVCMRVCVCVV